MPTEDREDEVVADLQLRHRRDKEPSTSEPVPPTEAREPASPLSNPVLSLRAMIDGNEPVPATNPRVNKVPTDLM